MMADHVDGPAIDKFQRTGCDRLAHDGSNSLRSAGDILVDHLHSGLAFSQGREFQYGFGDDRQGAFRADQQAGQVVTHHALGGVDAAAK